LARLVIAEKLFMRIALAVATSMLVALPVMAQSAGEVVAEEIDPKAYMGTWYEIARTPAPFQEQCTGGVTATYELIDAETVRVTNRCDTEGRETQSATGEAKVVNGNFNTFDVAFAEGGHSPGVNYVVVAASDIEDDQYQWAAVHSPQGPIGWILARSPRIEADARRQAAAALAKAGIDVAQLTDTAQPPQNYRPEQQ